MASRPDSVPNRRAIIDRRALADALALGMAATEGFEKRRALLAETLRTALADGRAELQRRLRETPAKGVELAGAQAFLVDQLLRLLFDSVLNDLYPGQVRHRFGAVGAGGGGGLRPRPDGAVFGHRRGVPDAPASRPHGANRCIETMLYLLWDLGLKIGHATRSLDDMVRMAKADITIRTALLESRFVWGDQALYTEATQRFRREVVAGTARAFTAEKLAERDERHKKMGDSRYVVEPNLKEGKGGLRDLHTLFWIGKYVYQVESVAELVDKGLFTASELRQFRRAESFLWAVRINLHDIAGRRRRAADLRCAARTGRRACAMPTGAACRRSSASCGTIS